MASRVAPVQQPHFPKRKAAKSKGYLAFVHKLPCVITGRFGVQACHLSFAAPEYGHYGRGKQTKAPDRWALPMVPEEHAAQHHLGDERLFWQQRGADPHLLALVLWGLWSSDGDDAEPECTAVIKSRVGYRFPPGPPLDLVGVWTLWNGGDCPVRGDVLVDIKLDNGHTMLRQPAGSKFWEAGKDSGQQIVAFRLSQDSSALSSKGMSDAQ